jgi:hypothetical protein
VKKQRRRPKNIFALFCKWLEINIIFLGCEQLVWRCELLEPVVMKLEFFTVPVGMREREAVLNEEVSDVQRSQRRSRATASHLSLGLTPSSR